MSEWKETKISEIVTLIGGGTPKTSVSEYWDGHIPWLSVVDFNNGKKYVFDTEKKITEEGLKNSSTKLLEKGDIIISARGTVGVVAMLGKQMAFNQSCYGVRANEKSSNEYVYYLLKDRVSNFLQYSHGGVFDTITRDTFKEIDIILPSPSEQKAIAEVLSSLDDKIDLLHRQNQTLEQMAETLFRQWFVERKGLNYDSNDFSDDLDSKNHGNQANQKNQGSDNVEEADEGWEVKRLDQILTILSSKRIFYKEYVEHGIPFFRSKEIIELANSGSTNSELYITEERFNEIESKFGAPREGDILLTSVGTLGISYQVRKNDKFYFKDGNLTWFKEFRELSSNIIYCWLNSALGKEALNEITIGSTQAALTLSGLRSIELQIPPLEIRKKLDNELELIFDKINSNQTQIRTITALRDTLLPKLMSGEVRVSV
jgi:type I restriction enzyme S subunit